ncbi:MAG TPA: carboxylating nicotinate-nucleotide diphosphorylase [bacterium]
MPDYAAARDAERLIRIALDEDLPGPDATTLAVGLAGRAAAAVFVAKQACTVSGLAVASRVFAIVDPAVRFEALARDGETVARGAELGRVSGDAASLLAAERTALNFLQRLCGIATATRALVDAVAGTGCLVLDTRKTTPGWRLLEKAAVRHGGGTNHRFSLSDGVLIKDNHVLLAGGVAAAVGVARAHALPGTRIEVEAGTLAQVEEALAAGADVILLDNAEPALAREAVALVAGRAVLELSGGITLENARAMAASGADCISSGALTHSAPAVDISLEFL